MSVISVKTNPLNSCIIFGHEVLPGFRLEFSQSLRVWVQIFVPAILGFRFLSFAHTELRLGLRLVG